MDPCTTKPIPGAAQALLRPNRIAVNISSPDGWGDVHITIDRDERATQAPAAGLYRIDAPSTGGDALWLTRGQLMALIAAGQALLEPKAVPAKWASLKVSPACVAEAERDLGPRLRPSPATLADPDRFPAHAPLHDIRAQDGRRMSDLLTSRTGTVPPRGLRDDFYGWDRSLDAPIDIPSGGHRLGTPFSDQSPHIVYADVRRGGC